MRWLPTLEPHGDRAHCRDGRVDRAPDRVAEAHAYVSDGHVLFAVESMPSYGALSGTASLRTCLAGARVEGRGDTSDTPATLCCGSRPHPTEPGWESPWGRGRPGWHLRMLGDDQGAYGRKHRHTRWRARPYLSPPRKRACAKLLCLWRGVCTALDAQRLRRHGR